MDLKLFAELQRSRIVAQKSLAADSARNVIQDSLQKKNRAKKDREYRQRKRAKAIALLGGVCRVCGMDDPDVLEFDHIEPVLRRTVGKDKQRDVYKEVLNQERPDQMFQLLCANCHTKKTRINGEYGCTPPC